MPTGPPPWFKKARQMYEQGFSPADIGKVVGRSRVTVRKALLKQGVRLRRRPSEITISRMARAQQLRRRGEARAR